jgi:hypothetical protein
LAYSLVNGKRHLRLGTTARTGLGRLRGCGDEMRDEIGMGVLAGRCGLPFRRRDDGDESVVHRQHRRLMY